MTTALSVDSALATALSDAALSRASGIAHCTRGKLKRLFCVSEGRVVYARSNMIEEQMTEVLGEAERVPFSTLSAVRRASQEQGSDPLSLLISEKLVTAKDVDGWFTAHIAKLFSDTMRWDDGEIQWVAGLPKLDGQTVVSIDVTTLIREHALGLPSIGKQIRERIGVPTVALNFNSARQRLIGASSIDPLTSHCLAAAGGGMSIAGIVESAPGDADRCWAVLYALTLLGCVAPSEVVLEQISTRDDLLARIERSDRADHYLVLDLLPSASEDAVRTAYYKLAREFHPDHYRAGALQDLIEQVEVYFSRVTEAYNTLINPELRKAYDLEQQSEMATAPEQDTAFLAEQNFRAANKLISRGRLNDAMRALENAVNLDAQSAPYQLELGKLQGRNPRLRSDAEGHLLEATRLDPSLIEGYLVLGELYARWNRPDDAIQSYREALKWEPGNLAAGEALKSLGG